MYVRRFAQRMMRVSNQVVQNVRQESSAYIRRLEREVEELKQELALHDSFANRAQASQGDDVNLLCHFLCYFCVNE